MARVRVYLVTYKRNHLLPRALRSLLDQTFRDWVCELHDDDPRNGFARDLAAEVRDPRVLVRVHEENRGGLAAFNLLGGGCEEECEEEFVSLLEDDNSWEPTFLEEMLAAADAHPEVNLLWSDLRFVEERPDGSWAATPRRLWGEDPEGRPCTLFRWPDPRQIAGALHSQGGMLLRSAAARACRVPDGVEMGAVEHFRERAVPGPLLLVRRPLLNYAVTRETYRSDRGGDWMAMQVLLAASYLAACPSRREAAAAASHLRGGRFNGVPAALLAAAMFRDCRRLALLGRPTDWAALLLRAARHPRRHSALWRSRGRLVPLWDFLVRHTSARFRQC